jgi:uncharacterized repeat protein (TIGR02543 family)
MTNLCWRSTVTCSVDAAASAGGTNYSCTGWTGTGSIPATGTTNATGAILLNEVASLIEWQWTASGYIVTFEAQGGTVPNPAIKDVTTDAAYDLLATTVREGYTFAGWWTGAGGTGTEVTAATMVATAGPHTLYAKWTANPYTLTFDSAGGTAVAPITQDYGTAVTAPAAPTSPGYTFAGWNSAVPATMPVGGLTLTAQWTANSYMLTFDAQDGTVPIPASNRVTFGAAYGEMATTMREGYTFGGWYSGASGTGNEVTDATILTTAENHTVYAKWTANPYTVTFDAQGGTVPNPASKDVTFDAAYGTLATTTRTGYTFAGWYMSAGGTGSEVTSATILTTAADHTLYAKWTANPYTVTFDAQGGTAPSPASKDVTFGVAYGTPATTTRTGYTLAGWYTGACGTGSQVDTATIVSTAQDHSLHAKWLINSHSLTVNSDHGTPLPFVGTQLLDWGSNLACSVTSPDTQGTTRHVCSGWIGTGSVPLAGNTADTGIFTLEADSSLTWLWSTEYFLDTEVSGSGSVDWADGWHAEGTEITANAVAESGSRFDHWTLDGVQVGGITNSHLVPMNAPHRLVAHFVVLDLAEALDNRELVWATGGNDVWTPQISVTHDGIDAACSGMIGHKQRTWLETSVLGAGTLSFRWKASSEEDYDLFSFLVDGAASQSVSGETEWQFVSINIDSAGEHVLRWEYAKDKSDSAGADCGWLDQVVWTPDYTGFALWANGLGLSGDAVALFGQDRNGDGVPNGFEYAFGTNAPSAGPFLNIRMVNGRPVVETPAQDAATSPYVNLLVLGSTNLTDWTLSVRPSEDTAGKPSNRAWHEPEGARPDKAFFKLEAGLK